MSGRTRGFGASYGAALADHLRDPGEPSLRTAYELGRAAVLAGLSVLDLAAVHHDALRAALRDATDAAGVERVAEAAASFYLESLSAYEMIQRGFRETRDAAALERAHAAMLRRLSTLLADASLALDASDSLAEMLQLVAEQARELTRARWSLVAATVDGDRVLEAVSRAEGDDEDVTPVPALVHRLVETSAGPIRLTSDDLARDPSLATVEPAVRLGIRGWLAVPLVALDGRSLGSIHVADREEGTFSELDEAVLVHLAQMTAAALERSRLYRR